MLSEKARNSIYQGLTPLVGEEATAEMLAHFPSTEAQQPVTREYLDVRLTELRSELRGEMADLRTELHQSINRLLVWLPASMAAIASVAVGISRLS